MRAHTQPGGSHRREEGPALRIVASPTHEAQDAMLGRCEAQAITSRAVVTDPYAAWLERREAERQLHEEIRWVYRSPRNTVEASGNREGSREAVADRDPGAAGGGLVSVT